MRPRTGGRGGAILMSGTGLRPVKTHRLEACATIHVGWARPTILLVPKLQLGNAIIRQTSGLPPLI